MAPFLRLQLNRHERARLVAENEALTSELALVRRELEALKQSAAFPAVTSLQTPERQIFIGCSTDKHYVEPTAVMLASVDANGDVPDATVIVSSFDLDQNDKIKLLTGAGRLASQMQFLDVTRNMLDNIESTKFPAQYPLSVIGKVLIGDYLGDCKGRLVTLDSDMIINSSLRPLFDLNMGDAFFAAVHDADRQEDPNYFNSGLTVCDQHMYRFHDIGRRCVRYIAEHHPQFPDQDALNQVIGAGWYRLDQTWNTYQIEGRGITLEDYEGAKVAHFAAWKPWNHHDHPGRPLYNRYLTQYRQLLARQVGMDEGPARDLLATAYEVLLGRELESVSVLCDRANLTSTEMIRSVLDSPEFKDHVLPAFLSGKPFPHGRFPGSPSLRQRFWAADHFGGDGRSKAEMEAAQSWRELLGRIWAEAGRLAAK